MFEKNAVSIQIIQVQSERELFGKFKNRDQYLL